MATVNTAAVRAEALRRDALARTAVLKIEFNDHHQDFLWWKLDRDGNVVDCGPWEYDVWTKKRVTNFTMLKVGGHVEYEDKDDPARPRYIRYAISAIKEIKK